MKEYSMSHIQLGIRIYNLQKMIYTNYVYDMLGNDNRESIQKEIERLQAIYDEEEKEIE